MGGTLSLESVLCETLALHDSRIAALGRTRDLNLQLCVKRGELVVSSWPHRANPACFPAAKRLKEFEMLVINLDIFNNPLTPTKAPPVCFFSFGCEHRLQARATDKRSVAGTRFSREPPFLRYFFEGIGPVY